MLMSMLLFARGMSLFFAGMALLFFSTLLMGVWGAVLTIEPDTPQRIRRYSRLLYKNIQSIYAKTLPMRTHFFSQRTWNTGTHRPSV
jgi:hypothetical protein